MEWIIRMEVPATFPDSGYLDKDAGHSSFLGVKEH